MAGVYRVSKFFSNFTAVLLMAVAVSGCKIEPPVAPSTTASPSTGSGSGGTSPISTTPKNVVVSWTASKALGVPAGGYKVYVRLNAAPTTALTTPTTIANAGMVHTTSTTLTLAPGRYFISISAYSATRESALSTPYVVVVP